MEQYEEIIARLEACVQALEEEIASLKAYFGVEDGAVSEAAEKPFVEKYEQLPDGAIDECYESAKITLKENKTYSVVENHHIGNKYGAKLDKVRRYIFVAMQLLKGETLKVGMSIHVLRRFFQLIYADYGKDGVRKALTSYEGYVEHRRSRNLTTYKHSLFCEEIKREYEL